MKTNQIDETEQNALKDEDIFNDIIFNKDEIKGTDETFFNNINDKNNSEDSLELEKSEDSLSSDKLDLCDKSMEEEMNKVTLKDKYSIEDINLKLGEHKITKDDLKTIPLPIFECIYCANEKIAFNHLINEELSLKYLYNTEKKDILLINFLQENNLLLLENEEDINLKNLILKKNVDIDINKLKSLIKVILSNREYVSKYYNIDESQNFLKQKRKRENNDYKINKYLKINVKNKFDFKGKKYGLEKNELFEDDDKYNDSYEKINKITKNIIENENANGEKNIKLDKSIEDKICNSFNKLLEEDDILMGLSRQIKWSEIDWDDKPYNIWNTSIDDDNIECENE